MYSAPTVAQFKAQFNRDFPYSTDINVGIVDIDITNSFNMVDMSINQALWDNQTQFTIAYLLLAAHYLVLNIRSSSQGLNGQYAWLHVSKAVGAVNESFDIPTRIKENPDFAQYYKTNYGAQYMNLLWPQLSGQIFSVWGSTRP